MKKEQLQRRFNPCFNGTYSLTNTKLSGTVICSSCFNPCFNGTYSLTFYLKTPNVLGKTRFNPCFNGTYSLTFNNVCIM